MTYAQAMAFVMQDREYSRQVSAVVEAEHRASHPGTPLCPDCRASDERCCGTDGDEVLCCRCGRSTYHRLATPESLAARAAFVIPPVPNEVWRAVALTLAAVGRV